MSTTRKKPGPAPSTGKAPPRSIRVHDDDWDQWKQVADNNGESVSAVIHRLMNRWVKRQGGREC